MNYKTGIASSAVLFVTLSIFVVAGGVYYFRTNKMSQEISLEDEKSHSDESVVQEIPLVQDLESEDRKMDNEPSTNKTIGEKPVISKPIDPPSQDDVPPPVLQDSPLSNIEPPLPSKPQCSDNVDNDGDGYSDYPLDVGCIDTLDNDESIPSISYPATEQIKYETIELSCNDVLTYDFESFTDPLYSVDGATAQYSVQTGKCFPALLYAREGIFLESSKRPLPVMGRALGHFKILVVFFDTAQNRSLLKQNPNIPESIKSEVDTNIQKAIEDYVATFDVKRLIYYKLASRGVYPNVSFKFDVLISKRADQLDLMQYENEWKGLLNYDATLFVEDPNGFSGYGVVRWPKNPLFNPSGIFAFRSSPMAFGDEIVWNEMFRRNVPVAFTEYKMGDRSTSPEPVYGGGPSVINTRNNYRLTFQDSRKLSNIFNGWGDVDSDGIIDGQDPAIAKTSDNIDGDLIPDYLDPDLTKNNGPIFWKSK